MLGWKGERQGACCSPVLAQRAACLKQETSRLERIIRGDCFDGRNGTNTGAFS